MPLLHALAACPGCMPEIHALVASLCCMPLLHALDRWPCCMLNTLLSVCCNVVHADLRICWVAFVGFTATLSMRS